jgi:hypothetical protein
MDDGEDSGLTLKAIDRLLDEVAGDLDDIEERFVRALYIGLSDGDTIALSKRRTVYLRTPEAILDARIAAIRAGVAAGLPLADAVDRAVEAFSKLDQPNGPLSIG